MFIVIYIVVWNERVVPLRFYQGIRKAGTVETMTLIKQIYFSW